MSQKTLNHIGLVLLYALLFFALYCTKPTPQEPKPVVTNEWKVKYDTLLVKYSTQLQRETDMLNELNTLCTTMLFDGNIPYYATFRVREFYAKWYSTKTPD